MPHEYGLKAFNCFLTTFKEMNPWFSSQFILDSTDLSLSNNSLTFDSMFWKNKETANLTMTSYHKIQVVFIIKNTFNLVLYNYFEKTWFQFLDDCEILLKINLI